MGLGLRSLCFLALATSAACTALQGEVQQSAMVLDRSIIQLMTDLESMEVGSRDAVARSLDVTFTIGSRSDTHTVWRGSISRPGIPNLIGLEYHDSISEYPSADILVLDIDQDEFTVSDAEAHYGALTLIHVPNHELDEEWAYEVPGGDNKLILVFDNNNTYLRSMIVGRR